VNQHKTHLKMAKQKSNAPKIAPKGTPQYKTEKTGNSSNSSILDGYIPILAVLALTFFAFLPTFQSDFVNWDDNLNIGDNKYINALTFSNISKIFSTTIIGGYNPLSIFSFAIERAIFGEANLSLIIHTDNLLLHLVNVYLVWRIVGEMGFNKWSAIGVALLFGIHPMRVESVAWATERKDVLFGAFYFAAILQYIKYLKSESYGVLSRPFLMVFGLFILSLFSKIQAVSLPLSLLALDYFFQRPLNFKLIFEKIHFFLSAFAFGLVSIYLLKNAKTIGDDVTLYSGFGRIIIGFYTYAVYLGKFIFPWVMSPLYPYPTELPLEFYAFSLLFVASIAGIIWAYRKGMTHLVFGWVFFFVNFIFVAQIVAAGQGFLADRFTYISYLGFFFILAAYTEGSLFSRKMDDTNAEIATKGVFGRISTQESPTSFVKTAFVGYALMCFIMTFNQTKVWNNGEVLWTKALEVADKSATAWQNRARYYNDKNERAKALADLNVAISNDPTKAAESYNSRGKIYTDMGDPNRALLDFATALNIKPTLAEAWANRGNAYGQIGKLDSALADITKALQIDSNLTSAYLGRGNVYGIMGRFDASIQDLTKALELDNKNVDALLNRSITYHDMKQIDKALADTEAYLLLKKDNATMWLNRGLLKSELGRHADALPDFDEAIRINALQGGFYLERARCYLKLGNIGAMRTDVQTARQRGIQNFEAALLQ
jgi:protein O-mannosyl-transferase